MKRNFLLFLSLCFALGFIGCASKKSGNLQVRIYTTEGDIEIELYPDKAPKSVTAFLSYVDSGYYANASFYRVLSLYNQPMGTNATELIQGGTWKSRKRNDSLPGIPHEPTSQTGILHEDGIVSLARQEPGTATTEFFICIGDQPGFDYGGGANPDGQGYAAFGKVIKGMDIVRKIYEQPEENQYFDPPIRIRKIERM